MQLARARNQRTYGAESVDTAEIRDLSARLAANRLLVQASTGNTSVKIGDTLWIKASGKWLADAASPSFLIPVALKRARACLDIGRAMPETENAEGQCASIETAMHAALPHRVVLHVHSVNAIGWAVRSDAVSALRDCLGGFSWQWIPYTLSGVPLAWRVQEASRSNPKANVFVLGNHGLVVCGDTCDSAERLLENVEKRLYIEPRPLTTFPDLASSGDEGGLRPSEYRSVHVLARDLLSQTILRGGVLYPCQALFLPSTIFASEPTLSTQAACLGERMPEQPAPVLLDRDHMLCDATMTPSQRELLFGLNEVVRRIYQPSAVRYLSLGEVSEVMQAGGPYLKRLSVNVLS